MFKKLALLALPILTLFASTHCDGATIPAWTCVAPENPDPCGRSIIARGSIEITSDGSVIVYNASANVIGAAPVGMGKIQVLMSTQTAAEYQVLLTGIEEVPSGRAPQIGRHDKWSQYFRFTPPSPVRSGQRQWIDFVVVGR